MSGPQFATHQGKLAIHRIYRLGVGDKLKVSVFGEENLSGQFEVNAFGQVSMLLIGEMPAKRSAAITASLFIVVMPFSKLQSRQFPAVR